MEYFGKMLVGIGAICILLGLVLWFAADKLGWFGHLPGDIAIERPGFRVYVPLTTMLLIRPGISLVLWLFGKFWR